MVSVVTVVFAGGGGCGDCTKLELSSISEVDALSGNVVAVEGGGGGGGTGAKILDGIELLRDGGGGGGGATACPGIVFVSVTVISTDSLVTT